MALLLLHSWQVGYLQWPMWEPLGDPVRDVMVFISAGANSTPAQGSNSQQGDSTSCLLMRIACSAPTHLIHSLRSSKDSYPSKAGGVLHRLTPSQRPSSLTLAAAVEATALLLQGMASCCCSHVSPSWCTWEAGTFLHVAYRSLAFCVTSDRAHSFLSDSLTWCAWIF